ncbi:MAG: pyridoxal-phosphate dependent enzyme, partial [Verrucomicrobiota bacterium]
ERRMNEIATELGAFRSEQFCNEANAKAHEKFTGPEIWEQTNGMVDVFLHFVGTSGSFAGVTRFLKTKNPKLRAYVVEPHGAAALAGEKVSCGNHRIQGGGYSRRDLALLDRAQVDGFLKVTDEQAIAGARLLAAEEGIFAGFSSGAHVAAAIGLLQEREAGTNIVFLACDSGLKYCSTELFT